MTPKVITSTALSLIVAMGATTATAQTQSSDTNASDQTMTEKIEAADAPDTAETDPMNERERSSTQMAQSQDQTQGAAILDLQSLSHDIYERGYRQGYIRGVQEARQDFAMQMRYMAKRDQLMENYQDWEMTQSVGSNSDEAQNDQTDMMNSGSATENQQTAGAAGNSEASSSDIETNMRSNMMRARPGGSIVILPAGISPERFIENLVDSRREALGENSEN
ncbi:hypothetical protein [uncultured Marivita sp.]|uniref:hypothetical protein n=1 Tax=uncultured Marivita sp. TaxID=888080 RepID=UPI0026100E4A|nr:hypothetical protein [uncultured Marivita sp.]